MDKAAFSSPINRKRIADHLDQSSASKAKLGKPTQMTDPDHAASPTFNGYLSEVPAADFDIEMTGAVQVEVAAVAMWHSHVDEPILVDANLNALDVLPCHQYSDRSNLV